MNDYLDSFEYYKSIKDMADLVGEIQELRRYYFSQQYAQMQDHIQKLMYKYCLETATWNSISQSRPTTVHEAYNNAEAFLKYKGFSILIDNGVKVQELLSREEIAYIEIAFKHQ